MDESALAHAWQSLQSMNEETRESGLACFRHAEGSTQTAKAWFLYAGALDYLGREFEAHGAYERVAEIGIDELTEADIAGYFVQAGSTLRNVGRPHDARDLLAQGRDRFPDNRAIDAFHALASWSCGDSRESVRTLLRALLATNDRSVARYARALGAYADELE